MRLDGIVGWRIPTRHHGGPLLLPEAGDPELDRFWIAQLARDVLNADRVRRNRALQKEIKAVRSRHARR